MKMRKLVPNPLKSVIKKGHESKILLIRHAESIFNHEIKLIENQKHHLSDIEYFNLKMKVRVSEELLDCEITERGKMQCYEVGKQMKNLNIKYIIVSPMKRCLMTCEHILASMNLNNNNQISPQIIVHPFIFEKMEDSCDLLKDLNKNMNEYSHFNWKLFNHFEHSLIYQLQFCDILSSDNEKFSYYELALTNYPKYKNYYHTKIILNAMEKLGRENKYIESSKKTFERLYLFKSYLNNFLRGKENEIEKVVVIGHSIIFKHLTSNLIDHDSLEPSNDEIILNNCESVSLSFKH